MMGLELKIHETRESNGDEFFRFGKRSMTLVRGRDLKDRRKKDVTADGSTGDEDHFEIPGRTMRFVGLVPGFS
ncbi:hypothetical protein ANTQUA_LOCUS2042 [Anthophora quadrimaculata]